MVHQRSQSSASTRTHRSGRRRLLGLAVGVATLMVLAGCGSSDSSPSTGGDPSSSSGSMPGLAASLPEKIKSTGVVRVASDLPFPPYEYTEDGKTTGFEYDLSQAMGKELGVQFEWKQQPFAGIIPGLAADKYDVAISSITDTKEREKTVDFVNYAVSQGGILVDKGNSHDIKGKDDLCGLRVAIVSGTTGAQDIAAQNKVCASQGKKSITGVSYASDGAAELAIKSGNADATLNDAASLAYIAKTVDGGNAFDVVVYSDESNPRFPLGIAVPKSDPGLRDAMQKALQAMVDDGTYGQILAKYGVSALAVKEITINQAIS